MNHFTPSAKWIRVWFLRDFAKDSRFYSSWNRIFFFRRVLMMLTLLIVVGCEVDPVKPIDPSSNLRIDSLTATLSSADVWDVVYLRAFVSGENISIQWSANHGTLFSIDSLSATYWGCPSCVGLNTITCKASNDYGIVSDTLKILINEYVWK